MANAPVPVPRTFNVAEFETAAYLNSVRDALNFLLNPPAATLVAVTNNGTSLASGAWTAINLDSSTFDNYGGHSNTTNNTRYTIQAAGKYLVGGAVALNGNGAASTRGAKIEKNGALLQGPYSLHSCSTTRSVSESVSGFIVPCVVGDYLELFGFQDAGAPVATIVSTDQSSFLTVVRLSS